MLSLYPWFLLPGILLPRCPQGPLPQSSLGSHLFNEDFLSPQWKFNSHSQHTSCPLSLSYLSSLYLLSANKLCILVCFLFVSSLMDTPKIYIPAVMCSVCLIPTLRRVLIAQKGLHKYLLWNGMQLDACWHVGNACFHNQNTWLEPVNSRNI